MATAKSTSQLNEEARTEKQRVESHKEADRSKVVFAAEAKRRGSVAAKTAKLRALREAGAPPLPSSSRSEPFKS